MDTEKELERLEICTKLVEGIRYFNAMESHVTDSIRGIQGIFPERLGKLKHSLEIYQMCSERLKERYKKAVAGLYS